jgi:hypothetical protein
LMFRSGWPGRSIRMERDTRDPASRPIVSA